MSRGEPHFNWNNSRARIESLVCGSQSHLVLKLALRDNQAVGQSGINIGCHQEQEFWFIKLKILIGSYEKIYSFQCRVKYISAINIQVVQNECLHQTYFEPP